MTTNPEMNVEIVGILRSGNEASQYAAKRIEELEAEVQFLQAEVIEMLEEAFRLIAHKETEGSREGWYDSMAHTEAKLCGDRLVELGLWERHPEGYGRRWWYRPIVKPEQVDG